jgi:hypothetical protein
MEMSKIEIELSKTKILLTIIGSILFVVLGFMLFLKIADQQTRFNPTLVKGAGLASIIFFGATAVYAIRKMLVKAIGLVINDEGIIDNTNASSVGLIRWADIAEIRTEHIASTKFLLIFVKDPQLYLGRINGFKKMLMQSNYKMYGTPLSITSTTLKIKFEDLERLVKERFQNDIRAQ